MLFKSKKNYSINLKNSRTHKDVDVAIGNLWDEMAYDILSKLQSLLDIELEGICIYECNINMLKQEITTKSQVFNEDKVIDVTSKLNYEDLASKEL